MTLKSTQSLIILLGLLTAFVLVGCIASEETAATAPPRPTDISIQVEGVHIPDVERGQQVWLEQKCADCHGPIGLGGIGPMVAATSLDYEEFIHIVRTAIPPKPAYSVDMLADDQAYDIYAWLRTQRPFVEQPFVPAASPQPSKTASLEDTMGMTIWAHGKCDTCHGVFAQGGPEAPPLAGLTYPGEEELARMRQAADEIPEHSPENISDEIFTEHLYKWLQAGCTYTKDCSQ